MLFARERPAVQERIKLERVITEGLGFVESRAATADVEIRRRIESNLPGGMRPIRTNSSRSW